MTTINLQSEEPSSVMLDGEQIKQIISNKNSDNNVAESISNQGRTNFSKGKLLRDPLTYRDDTSLRAAPPVISTVLLDEKKYPTPEYGVENKGNLDHYSKFVIKGLTPEGTLGRESSFYSVNRDILRTRLEESRNTYKLKDRVSHVNYRGAPQLTATDDRPKFSNNKLNVYNIYGPNSVLRLIKPIEDLPEPQWIQTKTLI